MRMGVTELIVIFLVAVLFFKPEKLKDYISMAKSATKTFNDTKEQIQNEAKEIVEPVLEVKENLNRELKKAS